MVVAEIGINHNGQEDLAHRLIDAAADGGADAVKFQHYAADDFVSSPGLTYEYLNAEGQTVSVLQREMFEHFELGFESLPRLVAHCRARNVFFSSTPTSPHGVDELARAGADFLKNGSDFITAADVVKAMAVTGLPTAISIGMATKAEVASAVEAFRAAGGTELMLLQCTSAYPTHPKDVHLRKIPALREAFGCSAGLSDHTRGHVAAVGAVALGAAMIEKHFTLDHALPGPDHRFSADPHELESLVRAVREIEQELGSGTIEPAEVELDSRKQFRLSCVASRDLPQGQRLSLKDVRVSRPGTGVPPNQRNALLGRILLRALTRGEPIRYEDLSR